MKRHRIECECLASTHDWRFKIHRESDWYKVSVWVICPVIDISYTRLKWTTYTLEDAQKYAEHFIDRYISWITQEPFTLLT